MTPSATTSAADLSLLRTALDHAACGIILYEAINDTGAFRQVLVNRIAQKLLFTDYSPLTDNGTPDLFDNVTLREQAVEVIKTGQSRRHTTWLTNRNGHRTFFDLTIAAYPGGVAVSMYDLTEQQYRREVVDQVLNNMTNGVIIYEAVRDSDRNILDYRTVFYNQQAPSLLGSTTDELEHQLLFQRRPESRLNAELLRRLVEDGEAFNQEYLLPGQQRWFSVQNKPLGDGFFTVFQDIDDAKRAHQQLDHQKRLLESVMNRSPNSITVERAIRDETNTIVDFQAVLINPVALQMGGYTEEEALTKTIRQLNPIFESTGLLANYRNVMETGDSLNISFHDPLKERYLELMATRMNDDYLIVLYTDVTQAKQQTLEIQRQKDMLQGMMDSSDNFITYCETVRDDRGQIVDFIYRLTNRYINELVGLPAEQVVGQRMTRFFPSAKDIGLFQHYAEVVETGQSQVFEFPYQADGYSGWYLISATPLADGFVLSFRDITQLKQSSLQIQEQNLVLDGVLNTAQSGITVYEAVLDNMGQLSNFRVKLTNPASLVLSGRTMEETIGRTMSDIYPKTRELGLWNTYVSVYQSGVPYRTEHYYPHVDKWFDVAISKMGEGLVVTFNDVTASKKATLQTEQQASVLQSVLDGCQTPIALFEAMRDASGQIVDFRYLLQNEVNARLVGHPLSETTKKTMLEVLPNLRESGVFDRYIQVVETGESQRFEQHFVDKGIEGWFDFSVVRQGDGIIIAAQDQTLLRQALSKSEQLIKELQRSNSSLEQFAYVASHDLQEPLRKIQSFGNVLQNQYSTALDLNAQDLLYRMQSAASRMQVLIKDLLTFSRLTTQQQPFEPVDLQALVLDILNDLDTVVKEKSAQLSISELPTINGNPTQLRQLFQNLLSNALKFTKPTRDTAEPPQISVNVESVRWSDVPAGVPDRQDKKWIAVSVSDNGIGFDEQYSERVFQLFERLHGRNQYAGTGLGLAISRKVAENHGGTISVRSQPDVGTTFTTYLPK